MNCNSYDIFVFDLNAAVVHGTYRRPYDKIVMWLYSLFQRYNQKKFEP